MIVSTVRLPHPIQKNRWIDESLINRWLVDNVGTHAQFRDLVDDDRPWHVDHEQHYLEYHFAREQDAVLFALKFGP